MLDLLLSDTLDGDEQAHDRGGTCGAICHVDDQALSDRPINGFVMLRPGPCPGYCRRGMATSTESSGATAPGLVPMQ